MTGYRLYGWKNTAVLAVEAALAELGVAHEVITLDKAAGEHQTAAFTRISPRQQVPVLELPDGSTVTEVPAILAHLGDAFADRQLIPPPGSPARAQHDRWMAFLHANVYEAILRSVRPHRFTDDPAGEAAVRSSADKAARRDFAIMETALTPAPYALGDRFQILDIFLWTLIAWSDQDWLALNCPKLSAQFAAVSARPQMQDVARRHFG
jgi:glutathione S-transferase